MKTHPECRGASRTTYRMLCASLVAMLPATALAQWPGWGGPDRNFTSSAKGLASTWPKDGPKQIWKRDLGEGYSSIAADDGRLYTMYRKDGKEIVVALNAKTGDTLWEHTYPAKKIESVSTRFGEGCYTVRRLVRKRRALDRKHARCDLRANACPSIRASGPSHGSSADRLCARH